MYHPCRIFLIIALMALLVGSPFVDILPAGSAPDRMDAPLGSEVPTGKTATTALREGHEFSVNVPIEYIISAQEWPLIPSESPDTRYNPVPYGMSMTSIDNPVFCGAYWKVTGYGQGMEGGYTWWRSRAYMKTPFDVPEDAVCTGSTLKMVVLQSPGKSIDIHPSAIAQYWDEEIIENSITFQALPDTLMQNGSVTIHPGQEERTVEFDVKDTVNRWFEGMNNNGIGLQSNESLPDQTEKTNCLPYFYGLGTGAKAPTLTIEYFVNQAPVARILSDAVNSAMETEPVTFTGEGDDPDGDEIALYEWSSDRDGLLGCGPDLTQITVDNLSVGLHKIRLRVRDDCQEHSRWSDHAYRNIQIEENLPRVTSVTARSVPGGKEDVEFSVGETVEIAVSAESGVPPYSGWVDIKSHIGEFSVVDEGSLSEDLVFTWDTADVQPDVYSIEVSITDSLGKVSDGGLLANGPDLLVSLVDESPPLIESITTSSGGEEGFQFDKGDPVDINVEAGDRETGLDSELTILDSRGSPVSSPSLVESEEGLYTALWKTDYLEGGMYTLLVTLMDLSGNKNSGEVSVTILDTDAPSVATVEARLGAQAGESFPVATALTIVVTETGQEEDLDGTIDIMYGGSFTVYQEPLKKMGEGRYYYQWNTADLEAGWYSVNVTLTDDDGNSDPDGLGRKDLNGNRLPDLDVELTLPEAILVVTSTVPVSGERDVPRGTMIQISFSQSIDTSTVNPDTLRVNVQDGQEVDGEWELVESGLFCIFDPSDILEPGITYEIEVTESVTTPEGISCTPFFFLFKTSNDAIKVDFGHSPPDALLTINGTDNITFAVVTDEEDGTFSWSLDDRKVPEGDGLGYTFHPDTNMTGWHTVEATPLGMEGEPIRWWVFVMDRETGNVDADDSGDGDVTADDGSENDGGSHWPMIVGISVMVLGLVLLLTVLVLRWKKGTGPSKIGEGG